MPIVSVLIPTYNHSRYILETLDSVWAQTYTSYDVTVINDGSIDATAELLQPLAKSGRIKYLEQKNLGQAATRNRLLKVCSGKYVAFLDDDDTWLPDKLMWQVDRLDRGADTAAVSGNCQIVHESGRRDIAKSKMSLLTWEGLFGGCPIMTPGQVLIRREALEAVGGFDGNIWGADDWDLWFRLAKYGTFEIEDRLCLEYRMHASNASRQVCRLMNGGRHVLRKQIASSNKTGSARRNLRTQAYKTLYAGWGHQLSIKAKEELLKCHLSQSIYSVLSLLRLAWEAPVRSGVATSVIRDLAPGPIWDLLNHKT